MVMRRGFSLTDLIATVVVACLVGTLALPALKRNRDVSLFQVSQARLGGNAQAQLQYATNDGGRIQYPWTDPRPGSLDWYTFPAKDPRYYFSFGVSGQGSFSGDMAAAFQFWLLRYVGRFGDTYSPAAVSPADVERMRAYKNNEFFADPKNKENYAMGGSYWLTPTVWFNDSRYSSATNRQSPSTSTLRRSTLANIRFPDSKVLVFERFGFFDASGNAVSGVPPLWCAAGARPNVAMADGSVLQTSRDALQALATSSTSSVAAVFRPSGTFAPTDALLVDALGLNNRTPQSPAPYAFFWATRNGLAGRDIDRTGLARQAAEERLTRLNPQRVTSGAVAGER